MLADRGSAGVPKSRSHHVITARRPAVIGAAAWTRRDRRRRAPIWQVWAPDPAVLVGAREVVQPDWWGLRRVRQAPAETRDARAGQHYGKEIREFSRGGSNDRAPERRTDPPGL